MKISVQGNIIDTVDIYKIGPVGYRSNTVSFPGPNLYVYAKFEICLYNHQSLNVVLKIEDLEFVIKGDNEASNKDLMNRINRVRDEIIGYWNEDKKDIINIEIDTKKIE